MVEVGADVRGHKGLTALALGYTETPRASIGSSRPWPHRACRCPTRRRWRCTAAGSIYSAGTCSAIRRCRADVLAPGHLAALTRVPCGRVLALHGAPLAGATLLHMAVDYEERGIAEWLLDRGADVNARALVDSSGFGGHTPLFNCVVTYNAGRADDPLARRLLRDCGADPNARASIRKRLPFARDKAVHEYRDVTPLSWGHRFHDQSYVSAAAMRLIAERGGRECTSP